MSYSFENDVFGAAVVSEDDLGILTISSETELLGKDGIIIPIDEKLAAELAKLKLTNNDMIVINSSSYFIGYKRISTLPVATSEVAEDQTVAAGVESATAEKTKVDTVSQGSAGSNAVAMQQSV